MVDLEDTLVLVVEMEDLVVDLDILLEQEVLEQIILDQINRDFLEETVVEVVDPNILVLVAAVLVVLEKV